MVLFQSRGDFPKTFMEPGSESATYMFGRNVTMLHMHINIALILLKLICLVWYRHKRFVQAQYAGEPVEDQLRDTT